MTAATYREDFALWWPIYDHKPEACHARVLRHLHDMDRAISLCRKRRVAVQAGGHAGLWPRRLAQKFDRVYTFEPDPALFECLERNTGDASGVIAAPWALGPDHGHVRMRTHQSAGSWRVDPDGQFEADQVPIDDVVKVADAIFLDVEGYEVEVLKGAKRVIDECRPIVHVEELTRSKGAIRAHMAAIGYRLHSTVHTDAVYVPVK